MHSKYFIFLLYRVSHYLPNPAFL